MDKKVAYAGGRGIEFDTHTSVIAKPTYPHAMKKRDMYRPASDMVDSAMTKPSMTPHHQAAMWKKRSPVLSAQLMRKVNKVGITTANLHAMHSSNILRKPQSKEVCEE